VEHEPFYISRGYRRQLSAAFQEFYGIEQQGYDWTCDQRRQTVWFLAIMRTQGFAPVDEEKPRTWRGILGVVKIAPGELVTNKQSSTGRLTLAAATAFRE
jgi:hypothetical protein